jgi:hypothetical protein
MIPWTPPRTWLFGEMGNETKLNTIRDSLIHRKDNQTALAGFTRGVQLRSYRMLSCRESDRHASCGNDRDRNESACPETSLSLSRGTASVQPRLRRQ